MSEQKFDVFIKGKDVDLVCLDEEVILNTNWYNWFNDEEITRYMQKHDFPNTRSDQLAYYKSEIEGSRSKLQLGVCEKGNHSKLLGCASLNDIDYINSKADIAIVVGEPEGKNVKIFIDAYRLLTTHAFNSLNLHRVYGGSIIKEVADIMCRTLGFQMEGVLRHDLYKDGKYHDMYRVGVLKDEFKF